MKKFIDNLEEYIGGSMFLLMLIVLVVQILSRQLFNAPLRWSEGLAKFLFVYVGYFGVSASLKENSHVYIEFFVEQMPEKVQKIIDVAIQIMILFILVIMFYIGVQITIRKVPVEIVSLGISYSYMYAALPAISLLMIYRHVERNIKKIRKEI